MVISETLVERMNAQGMKIRVAIPTNYLNLEAMSQHYNAQLKDKAKAERTIELANAVEQNYIKDWMVHCRP